MHLIRAAASAVIAGLRTVIRSDRGASGKQRNAILLLTFRFVFYGSDCREISGPSILYRIEHCCKARKRLRFSLRGCCFIGCMPEENLRRSAVLLDVRCIRHIGRRILNGKAFVKKGLLLGAVLLFPWRKAALSALLPLPHRQAALRHLLLGLRRRTQPPCRTLWACRNGKRNENPDHHYWPCRRQGRSAYAVR